jgi:3-oxoacyl-[acyl-carrier protein] reductase
MSKLVGKVAVVTGASKGIGAAIAEHLARDGASVVVNYATSRSGADTVVERITKAGGKAVAVQGDVSREADAVRLFAETKKAYGKLDILINNAGVYEMFPLEGTTPEHFHKLFDVNVLGLLLATREAAKLMGEGGTVLNISSIVGRTASPGGSVYSATKAAVDSLTDSLSRELGPRKIRVNSLNPGLIVTEGVKSAGFVENGFASAVLSGTPFGRLGTVDDIARASVFFASDDSGWVTGQTLVASGGARI